MLERIPEFYQEAISREPLYRQVLRDLPKRIDFLPLDFNPELPLQELLEKYSNENRDARYGRFCIADFQLGPKLDSFFQLAEDELIVSVQDIAFLSGVGVVLKYKISQAEPQFMGEVMRMRS